MPGTGDDLKQVRPGDPLRVPAGAYNLLMEMARAYASGRGKPASQGSGPSSPHNSSTILVYNNTGTNVPQYGVLALDTPLNSGTSVIDLFLAGLVMNGITPSTSTTGKYAIMLEPTGSNTIGWAAVAGMSQVILNAGTNTSFTTAESGSSTANLVSAGDTGSAQVIWRQGGTGTQWATVRLPNGGSSLPRPRPKYTVLICYNTTEDVAFDNPRFA